MGSSVLGRGAALLAVFLALFGMCAVHGSAQSAVKLSGGGSLAFNPGGISPFVLSGTASHLGRYNCFGEVAFVPGAQGSLDGSGVAVFQAANGDRIVGVVTWHIDAAGNGSVAFHWADYVQFSGDRVFQSTGRFATSRPPGAVSSTRLIKDGTSNIIAILIG